MRKFVIQSTLSSALNLNTVLTIIPAGPLLSTGLQVSICI